MEIAKETDTKTFLIHIIENRLDLLEKNKDLIKMLLSENLRGNLGNDLNLPEIIFSSLKKGLDYHFKLINHPIDIDFCARQLGGIFLSYIVLPNNKDFNKLTTQEKKRNSEKTCKVNTCHFIGLELLLEVIIISIPEGVISSFTEYAWNRY